MLIKSIKLYNIRSYINQTLEFPKGSVLLAGDIGAGKSSILHAIEFALFGTKGNELSASTLLRHGKSEGFVELNFKLENKNIIIKRTLKKGKTGINQGSGYIIINDVKKEAMPVELKADIIELLGYPKDLTSKSKDLVYRYTVYTPQEEMKKILLEGNDSRLDTLRKVFNIDKYKIIRENTAVFVRSIKEKRKEFEGFISDLETKKKEKENYYNENKVLENKLELLKPKLEEIKNELLKYKNSISNIENKINVLIKIRKEIEILDVELKNKLKLREKNNHEIGILEKEINEIQKDFEGKKEFDSNKLKEEIMNIEAQTNLLEKSSKEAIKNVYELKLEIRKSTELKVKIRSLSKCPLCHQDVSKEHKHFIDTKESEKLEEYEKKIKIYSEKEKKEEFNLKDLRQKIEFLRKKESKIELINLKIKHLNNKMNNKNSLMNEQLEIKKEIGKINVNKIEFNKKLDEIKNIEEEYKVLKDKLDETIDKDKKIELEKNSIEKEIEGINKIIFSLEKEIVNKLETKNKLTNLSQMQNWLEKYFINLMNTMERHVMLQVYREFNEHFKNWFGVLVEDESMSVRLDDSFSPVIIQNGYETNFGSLSGGERTAISLSYRLALNKVINDIASGIKTKDIIILDEPTDGFSLEQLDKVRDVLDELDMQQVIIVSHENKIESFVDDVIKIEKEEHVSNVV